MTLTAGIRLVTVPCKSKFDSFYPIMTHDYTPGKGPKSHVQFDQLFASKAVRSIPEIMHV